MRTVRDRTSLELLFARCHMSRHMSTLLARRDHSIPLHCHLCLDLHLHLPFPSFTASAPSNIPTLQPPTLSTLPLLPFLTCPLSAKGGSTSWNNKQSVCRNEICGVRGYRGHAPNSYVWRLHIWSCVLRTSGLLCPSVF